MKTYKIEQAQYNLKWHKDEETLEKFELNTVPNKFAWFNSQPSCFHISIYNNDKRVAFYTRNTYKEAVSLGKELCYINNE